MILLITLKAAQAGSGPKLHDRDVEPLWASLQPEILRWSLSGPSKVVMMLPSGPFSYGTTCLKRFPEWLLFNHFLKSIFIHLLLCDVLFFSTYCFSSSFWIYLVCDAKVVSSFPSFISLVFFYLLSPTFCVLQFWVFCFLLTFYLTSFYSHVVFACFVNSTFEEAIHLF